MDAPPAGAGKSLGWPFSTAFPFAGGTTIYPNAEGAYPNMPYPLEEIPNFTYYEAFRHVTGLAANFASENAARLASASLVLAVPEPQGWRNEQSVHVREHRGERAW